MRRESGRQSRFANQRGVAIVYVAVGLLTMLGFLAIAIDLGMLFATRSDAQRAADAAALAGASAFLDNSPAAAVVPAQTRAMEYALRNTLRNGPIDSSEITIAVDSDSMKVTATIRRDSVATWFGWVFGRRWVPVSAYAIAQAASAGAARCLKPFAVPDAWQDANGDANGNHLWDAGETWRFGDNAGDFYEKYSGPGGSSTETGYGSEWRSPPFTSSAADFGRQIKIKVTDPNDVSQAQSGIFFPWQMPVDPNQAPCGVGGGGGGGAAEYRQSICTCNNSSVSLDTDYPIKTGNMVGPTWQGTKELIDQDPGAYWDSGTNTVAGSSYAGGWMQSPRVVKIALFDPSQITKSGMQTIKFNNFALMFIEAQNSNKDPITGRFLYYASGSGGGPNTGSLVKVLQLVH